MLSTEMTVHVHTLCNQQFIIAIEILLLHISVFWDESCLRSLIVRE